VLSNSECSLPEPAPGTPKSKDNDSIHFIPDTGENQEISLISVVDDDSEISAHNPVCTSYHHESKSENTLYTIGENFSSTSEDDQSDSVCEFESNYFSEDMDQDEVINSESIPLIQHR